MNSNRMLAAQLFIRQQSYSVFAVAIIEMISIAIGDQGLGERSQFK